MKPKKPQPNTTPDGQIACAFGTPYLDHFEPPIGTGRGCESCEKWQRLCGVTESLVSGETQT